MRVVGAVTRPGGLAEWRALVTERARALLAGIGAIDDLDGLRPSDVDRLRAIGPAELVAPALELVRARRRATRRIEGAERLVLDVEGVEQASGTAVARHKARRFSTLAPHGVVDLCCGVGGDAIELRAALPQAALRVVDIDPVRAWMAAHNAGAEAVHGDAAEQLLGGAAFHVDPARRVAGGGRRLRRIADYRPGLPVLARLVASGAAGAIKLGPGVALDEVPSGPATELEVIGERGSLVQAVSWCGGLASAPGQRTATRLDDRLTFSGVPRSLRGRADGGVGRYLLVADPALERAGLLGTRAPEGFAEVAPGLGLLTGDGAVDDPWFRAFEVVEGPLPWREKRLKEVLRAHDAGTVRVKVRGRVADANAAEVALSGEGRAELWVLAFRLGARAVGIVARECGVQSGSA